MKLRHDVALLTLSIIISVIFLLNALSLFDIHQTEGWKRLNNFFKKFVSVLIKH